MTVIEEVTAERERQKSVEGWSEAHDDEHRDSEIADAAACYAHGSSMLFDRHGKSVWPDGWKFKDKTDRRNLIRAAALLVAEIERLDRARPR